MLQKDKQDFNSVTNIRQGEDECLDLLDDTGPVLEYDNLPEVNQNYKQHNGHQQVRVRLESRGEFSTCNAHGGSSNASTILDPKINQNDNYHNGHQQVQVSFQSRETRVNDFTIIVEQASWQHISNKVTVFRNQSH